MNMWRADRGQLSTALVAMATQEILLLMPGFFKGMYLNMQLLKKIRCRTHSLCRVLGSMRWMVLVTRAHTHTWPMLPRLWASRGDRHTTLSWQPEQSRRHAVKRRSRGVKRLWTPRMCLTAGFLHYLTGWRLFTKKL